MVVRRVCRCTLGLDGCVTNLTTADRTHAGCVVVCPASVALSLGARSMLDARSFMISTLRSQVGFAAAVAHARLRLSRLELIGGSGRSAGRYASAARAFISPTAFEQARGGALGAGGGRVGFAGGGLF